MTFKSLRRRSLAAFATYYHVVCLRSFALVARQANANTTRRIVPRWLSDPRITWAIPCDTLRGIYVMSKNKGGIALPRRRPGSLPEGGSSEERQ